MSDERETDPGAIRSEAHGPHWVAWAPGGEGKPLDSVILVGRTKEEAEASARDWLALRTARQAS